jgi:hypothetical protein
MYMRNHNKHLVMYLNNFQTYIFGSIIMLFILVIACQKQELNIPSVDFGTKVKIDLNETAIIGKNDNQLVVKVEQVNDSRCPADVNCISAGDAMVRLMVIDNKENQASFDLFYGQKTNFKEDTLAFSINQKNYKIILYGVSPYPKAKQKQTDKNVELAIITN